MKQNKLRTLYEKDMTKKILASLLSILIGLVVGSVIIAAVGFSNPELGASSVWDGFRLVFAGLFSTGRTASGVLTWGFNSTNFGNMLCRATPLIMTGLSVAVAFKTGLFNIGAPGQYLMGTLVSLCIALGYAVIVTYILKALVDSLVGTLMTADTASWFGTFSSTPYSVIPYHIIVVVGTLLTLYLGAHSIEKTNKIMMPLFFIIFLILAVRVAMLPGVSEGYRFMFTPRWEALKDPMIWIWAMGQAFFSLSVTGSGMIVYGAYLSKDEDVVGVAQHTAVFDTIAAVVAALVIIPACFSYGLDVGAGPSLLFVTLPTILQDIPLGRLFAVILYVAMIFAGVSSLQNMFEAVAESLLHKFPKLSRAAVLGILCVLCLGFGLLMEPISKWGPWMDLVSIYIIPIGATLGAISWFYVMKKDELLAAVNTGSKKERGALWYNVGRFVYVPFAVILCCVALFMHVAF